MNAVVVLHSKVKSAFIKVKRDLFEVRGVLNSHQEAINTLSNNEKALLLRIKKLEEIASKRNDVKVQKVETVIVKSQKKSFVGATTSMKVHDEHCPFAKNIARENMVVFSTKSTAYNKGFTPCECLKR